ncbi:coatomer subunit gamma [Trifolium repens]|nr:coatomer subunit gamma [Trifolium repens]
MIYFLKMRIPVIAVITMTRDYPLNADTPYLGVGKPLYGRVASDREATHAVVIVGHYIAKPNDPYKLKAGTTYFLYQDSFQAGKLVSNQSLFGNQINILHPDVVIEGYCGVSHIPNVLMTLEEAKEKKNLKHSRVDVKQTRTKEVDYCRTYHKNLELLLSISEFGSFGNLFKCSAPVKLTKAYDKIVEVVKYIFYSHVVFHYNIKNTISDKLLENVAVTVDALDAEGFHKVQTKPFPGVTYVAFKKPEGVIIAIGKFSNMLRFTVKEVDPSTGEAEGDGVEHEYRLENLEVVAADYILPIGVVPNFWNIWKTLKPESERVREYSLVARESLAKSVSVVTSLLGMEICQGKNVASNSTSHVCLLSGVFIGNVKVLVRLFFKIGGSKEVLSCCL